MVLLLLFAFERAREACVCHHPFFNQLIKYQTFTVLINHVWPHWAQIWIFFWLMCLYVWSIYIFGGILHHYHQSIFSQITNDCMSGGLLRYEIKIHFRQQSMRDIATINAAALSLILCVSWNFFQGLSIILSTWL